MIYMYFEYPDILILHLSQDSLTSKLLPTCTPLVLEGSTSVTLASVPFGAFVSISVLTNNSLSSKYIILIIQSSLSFI